ncbi:MAG: hypothetical protein H6R19_2237 [Proteobacteria bacterium]|nr:hypothetical protein [Pseudomonadota bacterium]
MIDPANDLYQANRLNGLPPYSQCIKFSVSIAPILPISPAVAGTHT